MRRIGRRHKKEKKKNFPKVDPDAVERSVFKRRFIEVITKYYGFGVVDKKELRKLQGGKSTVCNDNEMIFNRALGTDKKQSNFFVFMRETSSRIEIYYSNPETKNAADLKRDEYLIKRTFERGDEFGTADKFIREIMKYSAKKPKNEYRKISHGHWGTIGKRWVVDDGVSRFQDVLRMMMLYNIDYDATSPHNSFEEDVYNYLSNTEKVLGIRKIPALELTAALPPNGPNGPHLLLWMADRITARAIKREILDKREKLDMISYYSGMTIWKMLPVIGKHRDAGRLALGVAHEVNVHTPALPILDIGLLSAVENGKMGIGEARQIVAMSDSVAAWNPCIYNGRKEVPVKNKRLRNEMKRILKKHTGMKRLLANPVNYAFAREMVEKYNVYSHFDPDDHRTMPMNYDCGGDKFAQGFTRIMVPEKIYNSLKDKPSPKELIRLIHDRRIVMNSVQFTVKMGNNMVIAPERAKIPEKKKGLAKELKNAAMRRYVGALAKDFFSMLVRGKFSEIYHMRG